MEVLANIILGLSRLSVLSEGTREERSSWDRSTALRRLGLLLSGRPTTALHGPVRSKSVCRLVRDLTRYRLMQKSVHSSTRSDQCIQ